MREHPKDDRVLMDAIRASNSGHHTQAERLFREAGNQMRQPSEKQDLWNAAEKARRIAYSD